MLPQERKQYVKLWIMFWVVIIWLALMLIWMKKASDNQDNKVKMNTENLTEEEIQVEQWKIDNTCYWILNQEIYVLENWYTTFPEKIELTDEIKKKSIEDKIDWCIKQLNNSVESESIIE